MPVVQLSLLIIWIMMLEIPLTLPVSILSVMYFVHGRSQARKEEGCDRLRASKKFSHYEWINYYEF